MLLSNLKWTLSSQMSLVNIPLSCVVSLEAVPTESGDFCSKGRGHSLRLVLSLSLHQHFLCCLQPNAAGFGFCLYLSWVRERILIKVPLPVATVYYAGVNVSPCMYTDVGFFRLSLPGACC